MLMECISSPDLKGQAMATWLRVRAYPMVHEITALCMASAKDLTLKPSEGVK